MWEAYASVFQCRQQKFEMNQEFFKCFKNSTSTTIQYEGSIGQNTGFVNQLGSKEDTQEKFQAVDWYITQTK